MNNYTRQPREGAYLTMRANGRKMALAGASDDTLAAAVSVAVVLLLWLVCLYAYRSL